MKRYCAVIVLVITLILLSVSFVHAQNVAESSASLINKEKYIDFDYRVYNLRKYLLKYKSPLFKYSEDFIAYADLYGLDYRLVPAISGVESTFGKKIPSNSFNAYGWNNGNYKFKSWENSIEHVTSVIKKSYIDNGACSIKQIAKIYAPPSQSWGANVTYFIHKIDSLPLDFDII